MPDHTCPHFSRIGSWCRLGTNLKCPAKPGRVGCAFPDVGTLEMRNDQREIARTREHLERQRATEALGKAFSAQDIEWKVQSISKDQRRALVQGQLKTSAIYERLDAVVGNLGWQDHFETAQEHRVVKCRLGILGITKEDVAEITGHDTSAYKNAMAEALRRAATKFGIGKDLAGITAAWVDYDHNTNAILETPRLPNMLAAAEVIPQTSILELLPSEIQAKVRNANNQNTERPEAEHLLSDLIHKLRELPGGEHAIKRLVRKDWSSARPEEKRRLYSELRRTYRELSQASA